jgi:hypothetical protein
MPAASSNQQKLNEIKKNIIYRSQKTKFKNVFSVFFCTLHLLVCLLEHILENISLNDSKTVDLNFSIESA